MAAPISNNGPRANNTGGNQFRREPTIAAGDSLFWRGIDAMYSYRFAEAHILLDSVMTSDPDNPVAPLVSVGNRWQWALAEEGVVESYDAILTGINTTLPRYEAMLERGVPEAEVWLYMGSTYGLRARIAIAQKRWMSVLYSGLKGFRLIQRAQEQDSTLADAWLAVGLFDYYGGISSAPIQVVARMFGIRPDRRLGLAELERAIREAPYAWVEAASIISIIYLYVEDNPHAAYRYTIMIRDRYPDNYYFNFLYAEELVRTGRLEAARQFLPQLRALVDRSHTKQRPEWDLKYGTLEAALAFEEGNLEKALERAEWVISNYRMEWDWHLGQALYLRGAIREQRDDPAGALDDYKAVTRLDNETWLMPLARRAVARMEHEDR
ncbi:MAG: hypothetical protein V3W14_06180 [Candidatus Neomarinimicrobiota bacterium]